MNPASIGVMGPQVPWGLRRWLFLTGAEIPILGAMISLIPKGASGEKSKAALGFRLCNRPYFLYPNSYGEGCRREAGVGKGKRWPQFTRNPQNAG